MNDFKVFLKSLTISPGVYQFYNNNKEIIYVGKAKNLKKRVSSYFNKNHTNNKTRILVKNIFKIEYIVVNSEMDALLLENSLIKKYKPRYNVLLKDDKTFPWICLKKNPFPKVFPTRKVIKDGSIYFGPYPNVKTVYTLLDLIKEIYPFLNHELNHLMKINDYSKLKQIYEENKISIKNLINGNFKPSIEKLNNQMKDHSMKMEFEEAQ
jgi:excinuclease ABC subunit C